MKADMKLEDNTNLKVIYGSTDPIKEEDIKTENDSIEYFTKSEVDCTIIEDDEEDVADMKLEHNTNLKVIYGSTDPLKEEDIKTENNSKEYFTKSEVDCTIIENEEVSYEDDVTTQSNVFENCQICNKLINTNDMDEHVIEVHIDPNFPCEYDGCDKMFKTEEIMKRHVSRFHERMRREICPSCNKQVMPTVHRMGKCKDPITCEICNKTFAKKYTLSLHIKKVHEFQDPKVCPECGLEVKELPRHIYNKHRDLHLKLTNEKCPRKQCQECFKSFTYLSCLSKHMNTVHGEKKFTCDMCGLSFGRIKDMEAHRDRTHLGKRYFCPECGKTICDLKDHMRKVHKNIRYTDVEKYQVTKVETDKVQMKLDGNSYEEFDQRVFAMMEWQNNTWNCVTCSEFQSKNKFNVRNHIEAKHIDDVVHPCSECDQYFSTRNSASTHFSKQHKKMKLGEYL